MSCFSMVGKSPSRAIGKSFQPAINAPRQSLIGHVIAPAQSCLKGREAEIPCFGATDLRRLTLTLIFGI
ncbi:unnamed protein product [Caenorhabditis auriculariae]|uniref:Uncharacterized protein n=1 Tax=Caenorhabditis auriculariae TaxID=2777116 RepID=A0A8S1GVE2_9PELO|nr:unnamed protein product [Caenorhabditis auriculariae]